MRTVIIPTGVVTKTQITPQRLKQRILVHHSNRRAFSIPGASVTQLVPIPLPGKIRRIIIERTLRRIVRVPSLSPAVPVICSRLRIQPIVTRRVKIFLPPIARTAPVPLPGKIKRIIEPRTRRVVATFQTLLHRSPIFLAGKSHRRLETRIQRRTTFVVAPRFPASTIFMPGKTRRVDVSRTRRVVAQFPGRTLPIFLPGKKRIVEKTRVQRNIAEIVTRSPPTPIILPPRRTRSIELRSRRYAVPVMMRPFPQTAIFQPGRRTRVVETRRQRSFGVVPLRLLPTQPIALPRKILRREVSGVRIRKFVPLPVASQPTQSPVFIRRAAVVSRLQTARARAVLTIASMRTVPLPVKRLAVASRTVITRRAVAPVLASPAKVICVPARRIRERVVVGHRVTSLLPTASAPLPIFLPPKRIFRTIERRRLATRTFPARLVQNVTVHMLKKTW